MTKIIKFTWLALLLGSSSLAFADAKTEACEKAKKFLADQDTKGKCKEQNADAQKITCSATTSKQATDLQNKCIAGTPQKCTITKVADKTPGLDVTYTAKTGFELKCKTESKKSAEKWAADNSVCEDKQKTFKYSLSYGDKDFNLGGNCPKPEKAPKK